MSNEFVRDDWLAAEDGLARNLREAREATGMNKKEFAAATGLQESLVSRVENGKRTPNADHIRTWGAGASLDEAGIARLLGMLEELQSRRNDYETSMQYGQAGAQSEYNKLFRDTRHFRTFATSQMPGYLQVPQYARQLIGEMRSLHQAPDDIERTVQVRLERAEFLNDTSKRFEIILAEPVLRWLLCDANAMRAQLGRLYGLFGMAHIRFGIVPMGVRLPTTPQHAFGIYDDTLAVVETFTGDEKYRGKEPEKYIRVMDLLWAEAAEGDAARELIDAAMAALPSG